MSDEVVTSQEEVDLSQLIDFSMTFKPLQLTMQSILRRLAALEEDNQKKTHALKELQATVDELRGRPTGAPESGAADEDLWNEIRGMKELLGQLQTVEEQQRHTIDELYEARKQRRGTSRSTSLSYTPAQAPPRTSSPQLEEKLPVLRASAEEQPLGDRILGLAHEELLGNQFDATKRYTATEIEASRHNSRAAAIDEARPSGESERPPSGQRESVHAAARPLSGQQAPPRSAAETPDIFPAKQLDTTMRQEPVAAAAPGSRQPSGAPRTSRSYSVSLFDKLKRDGDDIAYLNRVVAEILGEMKELHEDVDLLRTYNGAHQTAPVEAHKEEEKTLTREITLPPEVNKAEVEDLVKRVRQLEETLDQVNHSSEFRDKGLQDEVDALRLELRVARRLTDEDVDALQGLAGLQDRLRSLEDRVGATEKADERLNEKLVHVLDSIGSATSSGGTDVHPAQLALLQGSIAALEKQLAELQNKGEKDWTDDIERLNTAVSTLRDEADQLGQQQQRLDGECARLEEAKEDRGGNKQIVNTTPPAPGVDPTAASRLDELLQRLAHLGARVDNADSKLAGLEESKADRSALQRLRDDIQNLKRLMELNAQRETTAKSNAGDEKMSSANEKLLQELQRQVLAQSEAAHTGRDASSDEVAGLRELIEQLDHRKADATLVANKAERDYVENALERLMREVEQVLNATNAGLIDTLDKSLNILRDMIDGKATKQDLARLRQLASADSMGGAAADGLTGFKGYRCLGCNRPMENLRPRPLPAKTSTFLNRNPQNHPQDNVTRFIQQQGTAAQLEQRPTQTNRANSGPPRASGTPPPLPPIDGTR